MSAEEEAEIKKMVKAHIRKCLDERPEFKEFLQQENVEGRFIKAMAKQRTPSLPSNLPYVFNQIERSIQDTYPINSSLAWDHTTERWNFWHDKHCKFNNKK